MTPTFRQLNYNTTNHVFKINLHWLLLYTHMFSNLYVGLKTLTQFYKFTQPAQKPLKLLYQSSLKSLSKIPTSVGRPACKHNWNLFLVYQQTFLNNSLPYFGPHPHFRPFFIFDRGKKPLHLNQKKAYARWVNTYNLLISLFMKQLKPLLFMTKTFRSEVRAFNWSLATWDYTLFKRTAPYFTLQETQHGHVTNHIFTELAKHRHLFSFITDIKYHEKNAHFLKRFGGYTIGVTPLNMSPWTVSYPIPVGAGTILVEYFFLSLLSFIQQYSEVLHYNELVFLWKLL